MKFFERTFSVKTDSIFSFVCSSLNILVFAPFRLVQEVSKKSVFLSRKKIDLLLFVSVLVSIFFTIGVSLIKYYTGVFSLVLGRLPLFVLIIGDVILVIIYVMFNTSHLLVYDTLTSTLMKSELGIRETAVREEPKVQTQVKPEPLSEKSVKDYDSFEAQPNVEVLDSEAIRNYQNRIKDGINDLESFKTESVSYSDAELQTLREQLDNITPPSKFISKEFTNNLLARVNEDEMENLIAEVIDLPENFTLDI